MNYKQKRLEIVNKISALNDNHCEMCPNFNQTRTVKCDGCEVFPKFQVLGKQLTILAKERKRKLVTI